MLTGDGAAAVREPTIKATEYQGVINALEAARQCGAQGRFLYMTASSVTMPSLATACLNLWKGNTLVWRRRAEDEIRDSGLAYSIIRTGVLLNRPGGRHAIDVTQQPLPADAPLSHRRAQRFLLKSTSRRVARPAARGREP